NLILPQRAGLPGHFGVVIQLRSIAGPARAYRSYIGFYQLAFFIRDSGRQFPEQIWFERRPRHELLDYPNKSMKIVALLMMAEAVVAGNDDRSGEGIHANPVRVQNQHRGVVPA